MSGLIKPKLVQLSHHSLTLQYTISGKNTTPTKSSQESHFITPPAPSKKKQRPNEASTDDLSPIAVATKETQSKKQKRSKMSKEEKNKRQREYRAKRAAEMSPEEKEKKNKKQQEYRAKKGKAKINKKQQEYRAKRYLHMYGPM